MVYLLSGEDSLAKDQKIEEIKGKSFPSEEAVKFDFEILHGAKLGSDVLKKSLVALPAIAPHRVVVIRAIQKLNPHNKELILEFIQKKEPQVVLILDDTEGDARNSFIKKLSAHVQVLRFSKGKKQNVFDMTKAMSSGNAAQALKTLHELMEEGTHPLQLMGGLIWYWGKEKNRLSSARFNKGLQQLQEADLNIKRSRLKPDEAMEVLVVSLMQV